jgi:protease-4
VWANVRRWFLLAFFSAYEWVLRRLGRRPLYNILSLEIEGELSEDGQDSPIPPWIKRPPTDYLSLIGLLRWAREDDKLRAVLIRCGHLEVSWARIQGLRRSLRALREAGKQVWVHLDGGGFPEYYLASAADRLSVTPAGTLEVVGLAAESMFFLDALEAFGVRAEVVQMGAYKSAGESFTRREMSAEHREMMESVIDDLYGQLVEDIALARKLEPAEVRGAIDDGPFLAKEALAKRLIDAVEYDDQTEDQLKAEIADAALIEEEDYSVRRGREIRRELLRGAPRRMAVVHVTGTIKMDEGASVIGRGRGAAATTLKKCLKEIREREDIEAVVLRVSSPGGSGLASDLIWRELVRTAEQKPLSVSFGDVAASGGYYVAVAGKKVFAEPGSLTGSIGVIAGKADLRGLYDKVGVRKDIVSRGRHAALYSDYAPLGDSERQRIRDEAGAFYADFVAKVAAGRGMSPDETDAIAQGRVWTGRQAWSRGLVDELGGFEEAFDDAKSTMGLAPTAPVLVERFPKPVSFWRTALGRRLGGQSRLHFVGFLRGIPFVGRDRVWARLPFDFRIR